jgi:PleD family two-component response regulator
VKNKATRRVLEVDDHVDAAESIAMILRITGHKVLCLYDAQPVLKTGTKLSRGSRHIDIGLPGMSGYELAKQLRSKSRMQTFGTVSSNGLWSGERPRNGAQRGIRFSHDEARRPITTE